jgi:hypothetical protein
VLGLGLGLGLGLVLFRLVSGLVGRGRTGLGLLGWVQVILYWAIMPMAAWSMRWQW